MAVLSKEEKALLNSFADSQPALQKAGKPLGKSQVKIGDALDLAAGQIAVKCSWKVAQGGTGVVSIGKVPAGAIVVGVIMDELVASDAASVDVLVDGQQLVSNVDFTALSGVSEATVALKKATAGLVTLNFDSAATTGAVDFILQCVSV